MFLVAVDDRSRVAVEADRLDAHPVVIGVICRDDVDAKGDKATQCELDLHQTVSAAGRGTYLKSNHSAVKIMIASVATSVVIDGYVMVREHGRLKWNMNDDGDKLHDRGRIRIFILSVNTFLG